MAKDWIITAPHASCHDLATRWNVTPVVAQLLLNRGVSTDEAARTFTNPQLRDLHPPESLPGTQEAARILADAVRHRKKVVLYGDYDVDGVTGIAVLWHVLSAAGAAPSFYVPDRLEEGYGLNSAAIRNSEDDGCKVMVSVDCGVSSVEEAKVAAECGVTLIITDHHTPAERMPEAAVIVHPTVGGEYPNPAICGAGVAFKLAWAVARELTGSDKVAPEFRERLFGLLPLVGLGTIADVVPLVGENRIFARHGLASLKDTSIPGLAALIESAGLSGATVSGEDVGFKLAPRINAAGRMGHARLAVELLTRADAKRGTEIALYLEEHNRARQKRERQIFRQACERVERERFDSDAYRGIVLAAEGWHAGVIGIVASRVVERYGKPTVLIALNDGVGQGSARSIGPFHMHEALAACKAFLVQFGGHAMAGGLRIEEDQIDGFTDAFVEHANNSLTGADLRPKLHLDAEVSLQELDLPSVQAMLNLGPFGQGNPTPRLATGWVDLVGEPRCVGKNGDHLTSTFMDGPARMRSIAFGQAAVADQLKDNRRCRLAFAPTINDFNGRRTVEMKVIDFQFAPRAN